MEPTQIQEDRVLSFGPFALDGGRLDLRRGGEPVEVHATPLRLLAYLLQHHERTVSKQELLDRVWPDSCVSEAALTSAIHEIRRVLDDDGSGQRWIRTERGRGYRFVGAVSARSHQAPQLPAASLVVLPFVNMGPEGRHDYLADGLTEELIHVLSGNPRLKVVSRTSSFEYKQSAVDVRLIGSRLCVGSVVEGSIRSCASRLRVTTQLIQVADGYHLWSGRLDVVLEDVLSAQDEIAETIAAELDRRIESVAAPDEAHRSARS